MSSAATAFAPIVEGVKETNVPAIIYHQTPRDVLTPEQTMAVAVPEEEEPEDPEETKRRTSALAYKLWQERGCPIGSDHIDWHNAELMIHAETIQGS